MQTFPVPLNELLNNFAGSVAVDYHKFSQKCIDRMRKRVEMQEKRRIQRRQQLLSKPEDKTFQSHQQGTNPQFNPGAEISKLARINKIKEAMSQKRNEYDKRANYQVNLDEIFDHFSKEIRPQILKKYPETPEDKIKRVTQQKWDSIDEVKKKTYIQKVSRKILLNRLQGNKDETKQRQAQNAEENQEIEVKREEVDNKAVQQQSEMRNLEQYIQSKRKNNAEEEKQEPIQVEEKTEGQKSEMTPGDAQMDVEVKQEETGQQLRPEYE